ncbi:Nif3-like dinuclear metal center hexameric protein [Candidatus Omnitrophota bacterium]
MAKVRDVTDIMETWAPPSLAETWDNSGLITGDPDRDVSHVFVTLDVTREVIDLAVQHGASMVISHHPPIFKPLYSLTGRSPTTDIITHAIKNDIALYAAHTNLDQAPGGVSWALAQKLDLHSIEPLTAGTAGAVKFVTFVPPEHTDNVREAAASAGAGVIGEYRSCSFTTPGKGTYIPSEHAQPLEGISGELTRYDEDRIEMIVPEPLISRVIDAARKKHPYEEMAYDIIPLSHNRSVFGYGAVGELNVPTVIDALLDDVLYKLNIASLRISGAKKETVQRIAVMGGSGSALIGKAIGAKADVFITGEIGYHDFITYDGDIVLVDATHRATELPILERIVERLTGSVIGGTIPVSIAEGKNRQKPYDHKTNTS